MSQAKPESIPTVKIGVTEIPTVLLGTSPFFGSAGFGAEKSKQYRERFLTRSGEIVDIIVESLRNGAGGVQTIAPNAPITKISGAPPLLEALRQAERKIGSRLNCVATVFDEDGIELLSEFNNEIIMADGVVTDRVKLDELFSLRDACKRHGLQFGLATHNPASVVPKLRQNEELWKEVELLACPINSRGYYMNGLVDRASQENRNRALETLRQSGKPVLAIKMLAAGRMRLEEGCSFAMKIPFVKAFAVGVGSVEEARQTFSLLRKLQAPGES